MQRFVIGSVSAIGIVGTLVLAGAFLKGTGLEANLGGTAMSAGVMIGIILGVLGVVGVVKRLSY